MGKNKRKVQELEEESGLPKKSENSHEIFSNEKNDTSRNLNDLTLIFRKDPTICVNNDSKNCFVFGALLDG